MEITAALSDQALVCASLGSPMYAGLLGRLTEDAASGGPTARVLAGHEDDPGPSALALRLLGSVHRLVLTDRAPDLAPLYPSVGGRWEPDAGAAAVLRLLDEQPEAVRDWLDHPPQTNEVGRAAALLGGLLQLPTAFRLPVRLHEIGASGGLNLLAETFRYVDAGGRGYGTEDSPVLLEPAWQGNELVPWPELAVVQRRGCDLSPVDTTSEEGRLRLTAYCWPDQPHRLSRLRGALALAGQIPPVVQERSAGEFVDALDLAEGTLTVLWHSVMWQYLSAAEQARVTARMEALGGRATATSPLAHLRMEPTRRSPELAHEFLVLLTSWPGGQRRVLGTAAPHGLPVTWEEQ